ncbi:GIY-YIG nuclease family protein [Salipiger sp. PrR003]|uniref:GIY-YIG nuclease family protein n=1 Tax=Salipiger sp. PrR003 TaxID=2706776 RepID=UPI0013DBCFEF|nr:GIY-YIG nuclease family protein [Salipiger sp. PrR003]
MVKSLSKRPVVQEHEGILFKIGTTRGHVKDRIARSTRETTYLNAPVEVVAEFEIHGYVPKDVEGLMHKFFEAGRADVRVEDERKHASKPSEWFFVTPSLVSQAMRLLNEGQLLEHEIRRKLEPH